MCKTMYKLSGDTVISHKNAHDMRRRDVEGYVEKRKETVNA